MKLLKKKWYQYNERDEGHTNGNRKTIRKGILGFTYCASLILIHNSTVYAQCSIKLGLPNIPLTHAQLQGYVLQSDNAQLVRDFATGHCTIEQNLHEGGQPCVTGYTTLHVTVRKRNGTACHVFEEPLVNYDALTRTYQRCTTCDE
jgi:hypothetical protein